MRRLKSLPSTSHTTRAFATPFQPSRRLNSGSGWAFSVWLKGSSDRPRYFSFSELAAGGPEFWPQGGRRLWDFWRHPTTSFWPWRWPIASPSSGPHPPCLTSVFSSSVVFCHLAVDSRKILLILFVLILRNDVHTYKRTLLSGARRILPTRCSSSSCPVCIPFLLPELIAFPSDSFLHPFSFLEWVGFPCA